MQVQVGKMDLGLNMYAAFVSGTGFTPAAAPTDIFYIQGAANKTIRVHRMFYSGVQTAANTDTISIRKRSTANTGGTAVATTKVPLNSNSPASGATVQHYTANPTVGTAVGSVWNGRIDTPVPTSTGYGGLLGTWFDFYQILGTPVILNGTAEGLSFCHDSVGLPAGLSVICGVIYSEDNA